MSLSAAQNKDVFLGKGRSAKVYRLAGKAGPVARKIFTGSRTANLIHTLFYGAPLDYQWCEPAIKAAFYRRKVLGHLLFYWFENTLGIADTLDWGIDPADQAYYLDTTYVDGHPATICTPFRCDEDREFIELQNKILPKLQQHLIEAGLIGTVWQAGKGQPCGFPNFLRTNTAGDLKWRWIDAESGVPAIASYHLPSLLGFYIPRAIKRGRILFDDLDIDEFRSYLKTHEGELRKKLGPSDYTNLISVAERLVSAHEEWQKQNRISRSQGYFLFKGRICADEYGYYSKHPFRWYFWLVMFFLKTTLPKYCRTFVEELPRFLRTINPWRWLRFFFKMFFINSFRIEVSNNFTSKGIRIWQNMGRIDQQQAEELQKALDTEQSNQYLADFGIHLAIKPLGYLFRLTLIPFLWQQGLLSAELAAILFLFCGMILRTSYSLMRCLESILQLKPPPLLALFFSPLPSVGTLAFPAQMIYSARAGHRLSQFIIYDSLSKTAEHIPIWGGRDTLWDHRLNRLAHWIIIGSQRK
jgi:hypothetical protein